MITVTATGRGLRINHQRLDNRGHQQTAAANSGGHQPLRCCRELFCND